MWRMTQRSKLPCVLSGTLRSMLSVARCQATSSTLKKNEYLLCCKAWLGTCTCSNPWIHVQCQEGNNCVCGLHVCVLIHGYMCHVEKVTTEFSLERLPHACTWLNQGLDAILFLRGRHFQWLHMKSFSGPEASWGVEMGWSLSFSKSLKM